MSLRKLRRIATTAFLMICLAQVADGYSVLTHEQIVDLAWKDQIRPLLLPAGRPSEVLR